MKQSLATVINGIKCFVEGKTKSQTSKIVKNTDQIAENTKKINGHTVDIGNLQKNVQIAQDTADSAYDSADNVIPVTGYNIDSSVGIVTKKMNLENGKLYLMIPEKNGTNFSYGSNDTCLQINGIERPIYSGGVGGCIYGYGFYNSLSRGVEVPRLIFVKNKPLLMIYVADQDAFYTLSLANVPVKVKEDTKQDEIPEYFYGNNLSSVTAYRYKYMRVKSSTPGSTKLFDITVDDTGTLTATEVTTT